jgi:hypothetical protein
MTKQILYNDSVINPFTPYPFLDVFKSVSFIFYFFLVYNPNLIQVHII